MKVYIRKSPRAIALVSNNFVLIFEKRKHSASSFLKGGSAKVTVQSLLESAFDKDGYIQLTHTTFNGLFGLITIKNQIFIGIITSNKKVGTPRWKLNEQNNVVEEETVHQILNIDFYCIDSEKYDSMFQDLSEMNYERQLNEHPCGHIKMLISDGSFYYSKNFDITNSLQERGLAHRIDYTIDNQDQRYVWNCNQISDIVQLRSRIAAQERPLFDGGSFLIFLVRGFCQTITDGTSASCTLISRISTEGMENLLEFKGIDQNGKVSNFVETELIVQTRRNVFSYIMTGGDIPLNWELVEGQFLHSRKPKLLTKAGTVQPSFDLHFDELMSKYGVISIVNISKPKNDAYAAMVSEYKQCAESKGIDLTLLEDSTSSLNKNPHRIIYLLQQKIYEFGSFAYDMDKKIYVGKQTGVFRISAVSLFKKLNIVEKAISADVLELTIKELNETDISADFWKSHGTLWGNNEFWLERLNSKHSKNPSKYRKIYRNLFDTSGIVTLYDPLHTYVTRFLRQRKHEFTFEKEISIFAGSFNVNGKLAKEKLESWLKPQDESPDIYVIGLEEIVELTPGHMLSTDPYIKAFWEKKLLTEINSYNDNKYHAVYSSQLGGLALLVFTHEENKSRIKHIEGDMKKTGFGGISSNKGAIAAHLWLSNTKFCFVVSHLSAGLENVEQRHNDYKSIAKHIRFSKGTRIKDHDGIIWMGDFNFRILLSNDDVRQAIKNRDFHRLFEKDQLNQQMISGESFPFFDEMEIKFPPTYKFNPGTDVYDTSEKMRIPAWTDRILSRGEMLKQEVYDSAEDILFSDHRPVYGIFTAKLTVIDEPKKAKLVANIKDSINHTLKDLTEEEKLAYLEENDVLAANDENNLSPNPAAANETKKHKKLPPPSSDQHKWWVGNGKQAKISLQVDPKKHMLNPERSSNPFIESDLPVYTRRGTHSISEAQ
ncbi:unnamed protein product [Kluyveromyces dobzhanskii CBS 2104]|uniref:phosphoinositide 5-phosphatase n=1 Tax=Kluyveromyces dobzhanskii CBS 2104 TaxID=1427455 RepID=A0A0A8L6Y7_9SACH|nr:unnamed protein product [Kluyveromyces dobzhanskii CBS 2104]